MVRNRYAFGCGDTVKIIATGENGYITTFSTSVDGTHKWKVKDNDKWFIAEDLIKLPKEKKTAPPPEIIESDKVIKIKSKKDRQAEKLRAEKWQMLFNDLIEHLFDSDYGLYKTDSETFYPKIINNHDSITIRITPETGKYWR